MTLSIIFENERVVVIDKPCGWLSVPSRMGAADPRPCAGTTLSKQLNQQLWPVHRLDFEVSGILLFAKDTKSHAMLNTAFEQRQILKTYEAITTAAPTVAAGTKLDPWTGKIVRGKKRSFFADHGKASETHAGFVGPTRIMGLNGFTWSLNPLTGRPHQLRLDLSSRGWPILGDVLYGGAPLPQPGVIALRAVAASTINTNLLSDLHLPQSFTALPLGDFLSNLLK